MPNACGSAHVHALAGVSVPVHMLFCACGCMCEGLHDAQPNELTHVALFAFGMDASQNTDISPEISHGGSQGERRTTHKYLQLNVGRCAIKQVEEEKEIHE